MTVQHMTSTLQIKNFGADGVFYGYIGGRSWEKVRGASK